MKPIWYRLVKVVFFFLDARLIARTGFHSVPVPRANNVIHQTVPKGSSRISIFPYVFQHLLVPGDGGPELVLLSILRSMRQKITRAALIADGSHRLLRCVMANIYTYYYQDLGWVNSFLACTS